MRLMRVLSYERRGSKRITCSFFCGIAIRVTSESRHERRSLANVVEPLKQGFVTPQDRESRALYASELR